MSSQVAALSARWLSRLKNGELVASLGVINRMIGAKKTGRHSSSQDRPVRVAFSTSERRQQIQREVVRVSTRSFRCWSVLDRCETWRVVSTVRPSRKSVELWASLQPLLLCTGRRAKISTSASSKENTSLEL